MSRSRPGEATSAGRDLRLDLVRGLTLLIIFVAHVPNNRWADFIPARLGFSSGAEIFVLCSGIASGLAFGGTFVRKGFATGCGRILRRMLQLYGAHLALLIGLGGGALVVDHLTGQTILVARYDLAPFQLAPVDTALAYAALGYVPAFFDILPLYIVLLALVPGMMLLSARPLTMLVLSAGLWVLTLALRLNLPNLATGQGWYFSPFAWQFLFVLGFGWARGWWGVPEPGRPWLSGLALAYVLASVPINFWWINDGTISWLQSFQRAIYPDDAISVLHPTRLLHVLALAYLSLSLLARFRNQLDAPALRNLIEVGQHSFPMFLFGLLLSMTGGIVLDCFGMGPAVTAAVNIGGILALLVAGRLLSGRRPAPARVSAPEPLRGLEASQPRVSANMQIY